MRASVAGQKWLWGSNTTLRIKDYISGIKLQTNNLPTHTNLLKGRAEANKQCSRCNSTLEYQLHCLQTCPAVKDAVISRHNVYELKSIETNGYKVDLEPRIQLATGNWMKPDLVVYKSKQGSVIHV